MQEFTRLGTKTKSKWYLVLIMMCGGFVHIGTAVLRLQTFIPYPKLLDFSAFYTAAYALRNGLSPYELPAAWLSMVQIERAIPFRPPTIYNPPFWPWILQPFTQLNFPFAAWAWLLFDLALLAWSATKLTRLAGYKGLRIQALILLLTLSFGPVFLDLTLGQTSILLLATSLYIGHSLHPEKKARTFWATVVQGIAAGAKLYPAIWLGAPALLRRWKSLGAGILSVCVALSIGFLVAPQANLDYWFHFLPQRITSASDQAGMDDQSLTAWIDRMGRPHTYHVPGLRTDEKVTVTWSFSWSIDSTMLRWIGYGVIGTLTLFIIVFAWRVGSEQGEAIFYLWVLYTLLVFPHIERYNHTLLLPAMAWLWGKGSHYRYFAACAYLLAGLSRLNHLWITVLPSPLGPLASGFGLWAVCLLVAGIVAALWPCAHPTLSKNES